MIRRLDAWLGKTLFFPLIVRVCQHAKISQYRLGNYALLMGLMCLLTRAPERVPDWIVYGILAVFATASVWVCSGPLADRRHGVSPQLTLFFRLVCWFFVAIDLLLFLLDPGFRRKIDASQLYFPLLLVYYYAHEIDTIPPLEERRREKSALAPRRSPR